MAKKLYLLREELTQVDFPTKVKYLYTSELNKNLVTLVEASFNHYLYISSNFGYLEPNDIKDPYKVKYLNPKPKKLWSLYTAELIKRFCHELNISTISLLYSGDYLSPLEELLKNYGFTLEFPLKYFKTSDLKNKWALSELQKTIYEKLTSY